jgi:hypothetical protein
MTYVRFENESDGKVSRDYGPFEDLYFSGRRLFADGKLLAIRRNKAFRIDGEDSFSDGWSHVYFTTKP